MRARLVACLVLSFGALFHPSPLSARDAEPINLLALPIAKLEHATDPRADDALVRALADGNATKAVTLASADTTPVSLVIGFGGNLVSLEGIEISLGEAAGSEQRAASVDVLVSQLSPRAGFQSVRSDPLKATGGAQKFSFPAVGAKWVLLKFTAPPNSNAVAVAEVKVVGREGPPQTRYKFKESPAKAFDVLKQLESSAALNLSISPDEASLFTDARDGKLDQWSFAEAALVASGILQADQRKLYLERLNKVEAEARKAVSGSKEPFTQGAALLKFLHTGPMAKGYLSRQTNLSTILDTGQFNCVSSAALYNILGRRLGLDLRAIEVPDHAFSILYDGTNHADVETTTPDGFNPSRNKVAQAEFEKLTGFAYIPDGNRDRRREVGEVGLLSIIFYNHGVELMGEKRYPEALLAYFRAMSLDPEFASAVQNALAVLANWSGELSRQRQFEEALKVTAIGLQLAPQDAALVNNHKAVWSQWADTLAKEGKADDALAILRRAESAIPDGGFARMQSWVFLREGEEHIKAGNWTKAIAIVQPALARNLDPAAREEVVAWAANLHGRWAQSEMRRGNFSAALDLLAKRMAEEPQDQRARQNVAYVVQEQLRDKAAKEGPEAAEKVIPELLARFSQLDEVRQVGVAHLQRTVRQLSDEGRHDQALAAATRMASLTSDPKLEAEAKASVYDHWALGLSKEKKWEQALDVYAKALPSLADKSRAENNVRYILQEWLKDTAAQGPAAAKDILQRQIARFAEVKGIADLARGHVSRTVQELVRQGQYEPALVALNAHADLLPEPKVAAEIAASVFDKWSDSLRQKGDWQDAVDIYDRGLKLYPKDRHLENNAVATWDRWSRTFMDRKDWKGAIGIYEKALERFPNNGTLTHNLKYCREQMQKGG
jgi:tetratricopeptide (TPR) repeat protein